MIRGTISTAAAVLALAAPAAALADDAYEPNDSESTATGPITPGQSYAAQVAAPSDDDVFLVRATGGQMTIDATVTRDGCPDTEDALTIAVVAKGAFGGSGYGSVETVGSSQLTVPVDAGRDYTIRFTTPLPDDTTCTDRSVDYNFTATGAIQGPPAGGGDTGGGDTGGGGTTTGGPRRLSSRPAFRNYACLYRSSGYTGFEDPPFRFTLKRGGVWVDRSTAARPKARWKWRNRKLTLYTKRGRRLHTFAHFRDSSGKYLRQHPVPRNNNPLICR
jgi:hypothetical protein